MMPIMNIMSAAKRNLSRSSPASIMPTKATPEIVLLMVLFIGSWF